MKLGRGVDGKFTPIPSVSPTTSTLMDSTGTAKLNSWEPLPWLSGKDASRDQLMIPWLKAQSELPFPMWLRPSGSGRMIDPTQPRTKMASLEDFYRGFIDPSERTETQPKNSRRPLYPAASSEKYCGDGQTATVLQTNWRDDPVGLPPSSFRFGAPSIMLVIVAGFCADLYCIA